MKKALNMQEEVGAVLSAYWLTPIFSFIEKIIMPSLKIYKIFW